ncbi:hypothetical protein ACPTI2_13485, partial [Enterococcus faecalis]
LNGIKIYKILNYFADPVLVMDCLYGMVASLTNNGWEAVSQYKTQTKSTKKTRTSKTIKTNPTTTNVTRPYT